MATPRFLLQAGARQVAVLVATLLVGSAEPVRPGEEPPPLEQIKGDLKAVKPGAASELAAPKAGSVLLVPGFAAPTGDSPPVPPPPSDSAEKKRLADPNWLLHAMEAPPKAKTIQQRGGSGAEARQSDTDPLDPRRQDFMLKIYREQEIRDQEHRDNPTDKTDARLPKPGDVGPFGDLLKHWISPRDLTLLGLDSNSPSADSSDIAPPAPSTTPPPAQPVATPRGPNPFLDAMQLDLPAPTVGPTAPLPSVGPALAPPAMVVPGPPPLVTPPAPGNDRARLPPGRQAEDKKYFPQLNRF